MNLLRIKNLLNLILFFFVILSPILIVLKYYIPSNNLVLLDTPSINNDLFHYSNPNDLTNEKNNSQHLYSLLTTGDVMLGRQIAQKMHELGNYNYPFEKIGKYMRGADIIFINLESALFSHCLEEAIVTKSCGDSKAVSGLLFAGVNMANLANNHTTDYYGEVGLNNTKMLLQDKGISVTGIGEPSIVEVRGKKFGFLGYNDVENKYPGVIWADVDLIREDITKLKKQVDFIVVAFHWGDEYSLIPNKRQIELGHKAVDAGANLVIGNHPHWVQGIERYNGSFISYSQGNFVFDQIWSQPTREGMIEKYIFDDKGIRSVKLFPTIIGEYGQVRLANDNEANQILERMKYSTSLIKS